MSDLPLPENLADWPSDPFVLFGVTHAVSQRDLRKVYTRLIREFKPERLPEHFRRIREAYETLQQYAAWNEMRASDSETEPPPVPLTTAETTAKVDESEPHESAVRTSVETEESCWRWAVAGEPERAYRALSEMLERRPDQLGPYLKLYWLLLAMPGLDASCAPADWLARGLASCGQFARLLERYAEELADDPQEALSPRFAKLLGEAGGPLLPELLEKRWQALTESGRWDVVAADLDAFCDRVCRYDEVAWLRLLLSLAAKSVRVQLQDIENVFRSCQARIQGLGHLGLAHSTLFDRAEMLSRLAQESSAILPRAVVEVVGHFLAGRIPEAGRALEPFMAVICAKPGDGLRVLDSTASMAPHTFLEFGRALDWLFWNNAKKEIPSHDEETCDLLVHRLLAEVIGNGTYPKERAGILNYCCAEALSPEQLCETLQAGKYAPNYLGPLIASDVALCWTYRVFRLGWAM
jgi:hypothetical protein